MAEINDPRMPERFWRKVEVDPETGCWLWTAYLTSAGYGQFQFGCRHEFAHRAAYAGLVGPIPEGLQIDHLCRNRRCCNPDHLEPVTQKENLLRGDTIVAACAAKTHCPHGHPYAGDNLRIQGKGARYCKICNRLRQRRWKQRQRDKANAAQGSV